MNKEVLRERKESNLFEWRRYLQILDMLKDDRSQPYIAKKLGFKNASSIANILNRFQGLETLISEHTAVVERNARIDELTRIERLLSGHKLPNSGSDKTNVLAWCKDRLKALNSKGKE